MGNEIKTLEGWTAYADRTGKEDICDYLNAGDVISENIVDNFLEMLPPRSYTGDYVQFGEPSGHSYDLARQFRPVYLTFAHCDGIWRFYGKCFVGETIDRSK